MRFLMMWQPTENAAALAPPPAGLMAAMDELMADTTKSGIMIDAGGMLPVSMGARLRLAGGNVTITDGPFSEAKELIGGYCIVRTSSKEEAIEMARRFMDIHAAYGYEGVSTVQQLLGPEDFDPTQAAGAELQAERR